MKNIAAGLAAIVAMAVAPAVAQNDMTEEIQELEQPGSEIEMDIGGGGVDVRRKSGAPVFAPGEVPRGGLIVDGENPGPPIDDPDTPYDGGDPIDAEMPGEGPEDLSGAIGEDD
ncbi:MAG: hypothetical protein FJX44_08920 [Alphaproteobacteria bacterium]|nr:hypothetical protein [Alphaproteobacteria bacterium]